MCVLGGLSNDKPVEGLESKQVGDNLLLKDKPANLEIERGQRWDGVGDDIIKIMAYPK